MNGFHDWLMRQYGCQEYVKKGMVGWTPDDLPFDLSFEWALHSGDTLAYLKKYMRQIDDEILADFKAAIGLPDSGT